MRLGSKAPAVGDKIGGGPKVESLAMCTLPTWGYNYFTMGDKISSCLLAGGLPT